MKSYSMDQVADLLDYNKNDKHRRRKALRFIRNLMKKKEAPPEDQQKENSEFDIETYYHSPIWKLGKEYRIYDTDLKVLLNYRIDDESIDVKVEENILQIDKLVKKINALTRRVIRLEQQLVLSEAKIKDPVLYSRS